MLRSIFIDNYALIDKLELDFDRGLTIITGETGAGKSILLGALGLLLGKRADTSVLKSTERKCVVEGTIDIKDYKIEFFFTKNELDYHPETILRREISSSGKSRAFINDTPVTLNVLQDLAVRLIDIHSQHQNLSLNNEEYIRWIIDTYARARPALDRYQKYLRNFQRLKADFDRARTAFLSDKENQDYLTHQFQELQNAKLNADELEALEAELEILAHAEDIKTALSGSLQILDTDDTGILSKLKQAIDLLAKISSHMDSAGEMKSRMDSVFIELKDLSSELSSQSERMEFDPGRMEMISQRMDVLYGLLRKYKTESISELIAFRDGLDAKLQQLATGDYALERLSQEMNEQEGIMMKAATELSDMRKKIFPPFQQKVLQLIHNLGLQHSKFQVEHTQVAPGENGIDQIEFLFSANENIAAKSISKVASGGELSRLMLSIKYLISHSSGLPTIIFDEIDTGVSGDIADKVGSLIHEMASTMQVINITHLPQVASKGQHHLRVIKRSQNGQTQTLIEKLTQEERIHEIAKMLSGDAISEAAIENAKVLLKN